MMYLFGHLLVRVEVRVITLTASPHTAITLFLNGLSIISALAVNSLILRLGDIIPALYSRYVLFKSVILSAYKI